MNLYPFGAEVSVGFLTVAPLFTSNLSNSTFSMFALISKLYFATSCFVNFAYTVVFSVIGLPHPVYGWVIASSLKKPSNVKPSGAFTVGSLTDVPLATFAEENFASSTFDLMIKSY